MTDIYTLGLKLDTSQGAQAAQDWNANVQKVQQSTERAEKATASWAKQFGLAKGQLKEFGAIGASVFAGDIISKALGFANVMGAINTATGLVADGVRVLAGELRDQLFPEWAAQIQEQEAFRAALDQTSSRIAAVRDALRGRGANVAGPLGATSFISTAGLDLENELKVLTAVEEASKRIQAAIARNRQIEADRLKANSSALGIAGPLAGEALTDTRKLYVEQVADLYTLTAQLQRKNDLQREELDIAKKINNERDRYLASQPFITEQDYAVPNGPDPYANVFPNVLGPEALRPFGPENGPGGRLAPFGQGPIRNGYFGNGLGQQGFAGGSAAFFVQLSSGIAEATKKGLEFVKVQAEIEEAAKRAALANQIGFTLAAGFEDAIFSGQKLSEVLRQLALDLARIVFRNTVTQPLGNFLAGAINGGSTQPFTNGSGPIAPRGGSTQPFTAGGVGGGFRLSGRQQRESLARSF